MSKKIKNGGPAFPSGEQYRNGAGDLCGKSSLYEGMTLRDYFAAKAMQGLLAADKVNGTDWTDCKCAEYAYEMADQMLKKRGEL